jgi:hypothetical protein
LVRVHNVRGVCHKNSGKRVVGGISTSPRPVW